MTAFPDCLLGIEPVPIDPAVPVCLHGHVEHVVAEQSVEEVSPVAEVGRSIRHCRLDDYPRGRDLAPLDRHAEAIVGRPPAPETDKDSVASLLHQPPVDGIQLRGHHSRRSAIEMLRPQIDHVDQVAPRTLAQAVVRRHQDVVALEVDLLDGSPLAWREHGAHLDKPDLHRQGVVAVEIDCELDLGLAVDNVARQFQQALHHRSERDRARLEQRREGQSAGPVAPDAGPQLVRRRVPGGRQERERAVSLRITQTAPHQTGGLPHWVRRRRVAHIDRPEAVLGELEKVTGALEGRWSGRTVGTVTPHVVAVRDRLAQSQGHSHHPVFALVAGHGIVVVRTREPRQGRVETPVVTGACDLLNDDRHFFGVVGEPARTTGDHRVFEKCRGPGELDRARETSITSVVVLLGIGYHLGGENAREGALLRVFEITRRPDGEGRLQDPEERSVLPSPLPSAHRAGTSARSGCPESR